MPIEWPNTVSYRIVSSRRNRSSQAEHLKIRQQKNRRSATLWHLNLNPSIFVHIAAAAFFAPRESDKWSERVRKIGGIKINRSPLITRMERFASAPLRAMVPSFEYIRDCQRSSSLISLMKAIKSTHSDLSLRDSNLLSVSQNRRVRSILVSKFH